MIYGSADDEGTRFFLTHQPARDVEVGAFLIARTEVTNADYMAFLDALPEPERQARLPAGLTLLPGGRIAWKQGDRVLRLGEPYCRGREPCVDWLRLPVMGTNRDDGESYVRWLAREGRLPGARLCTDREWERAARGADDRRFPAGNADLGAADACTLAPGPCIVGTHLASRSPFGVDDQAGNEREWTSDSAEVANPMQGIVRDEYWGGRGLYQVIANRGLIATASRSSNLGLRVCASIR
jgi:formylglycine-generating enzyme required for sulfatase activity